MLSFNIYSSAEQKKVDAFWKQVLLPVKCNSQNPLQIFLDLFFFFFQTSEQQKKLFYLFIYFWLKDVLEIISNRLSRFPKYAICKNVI